MLLSVFLDGRPVFFPLFDRVGLDLVFLQEAVELPARGDTKQGTELVPGEAALAEGFQSPGFEGGAGGVLTGSGQRRGEVVGNVECDPRCFTLARTVAILQ